MFFQWGTSDTDSQNLTNNKMASFFAKIHEFICWILTVLCGWTAQRVYSDDELDVFIAPCVTDDYIRHDAVIQTDGFGICVQCEEHLTPWCDLRYRTRSKDKNNYFWNQSINQSINQYNIYFHIHIEASS